MVGGRQEGQVFQTFLIEMCGPGHLDVGWKKWGEAGRLSLRSWEKWGNDDAVTVASS